MSDINFGETFTPKRSKSWLWIIIAILVLLLVAVVIIGVVFYFKDKKGPTGATGGSGKTGGATALVRIDCSLSEWSAWSDCSNNIQTRTRRVIRPPQNGGTCFSLTETRDCRAVDCSLSEWSEWSDCSNNSRTRTRRVIREPQFGGATCENLVETQFCGKIDCSMSDWVYGPCIDGSQNATRTILIPPRGEGATVCDATAEVFSCETPKVYLSITEYNNSVLGPAYLSIREIQSNKYLVATMLPTETNSGFTLGSNSTLKYNNQFVNMNRDTGVLSFTNDLNKDTIVVDKINDTTNRLLLDDKTKITSSSKSYIGSYIITLNNIDYRVCRGTNSTDQTILRVGQNNNLSVIAKPLFFTIANSNPPKYLESTPENNGGFFKVNLSEFAYITDDQNVKIYNDNTKYYLDLATNYLLKDNCYMTFNSSNIFNIVAVKNCSNLPTEEAFKIIPSTITGLSTTDQGIIIIDNRKIQYKTNKITGIPYYPQQITTATSPDYNDDLDSTTDFNSASIFSIINNPSIIKPLEFISYQENPYRYLAITTIDGIDYLYLSNTPIQKFYLAPGSSALMVLKDNQYQFLKLEINTTNSYLLSYTTIKPFQVFQSNGAGYIKFENNKLVNFFNVNNLVGGSALGEVNQFIGGSQTQILTWVSITNGSPTSFRYQ